MLAPNIPLGSVSLVIILGALVGNGFKIGQRFETGIRFCEKTVLAVAIVLMGVKLDFLILKELGFQTLLLITTGLVLTILLAVVLGRVFKINHHLALLLGIGSGICGSSAIAATEGIVGADKQQVGISVAVVNFLGTLGIFLLPALARAVLGLDDFQSGVLVGNTLQAVGQVVAAGFSISEKVGTSATVVKMARILMLTPLMLILAAIYFRRNQADGRATRVRGFGIPWFVWGFALMTMVPTFKLMPDSGIDLLASISHWALLLAMAAIGLRITFASILSQGKGALTVGSLVFIFQIVFSASWLLLMG